MSNKSSVQLNKSKKTTIQLDKSLINELKQVKSHPRESYNELISKMLKLYKISLQKNSFDEFLFKIQRMKMSELWDNKDDEMMSLLSYEIYPSFY